MPMGQMPCLEVDGRRVHQSLAMCRYVAKQINLAGNDAIEDLQVDSIVDTINDFRLSKYWKFIFVHSLKKIYWKICLRSFPVQDLSF